MNKTIFVSRHPGAIAWIKDQAIQITEHVSHLSSEIELKKGDVVIGTLPINIVAELNQLGIRYIHLSLVVSPNMRGKELTKEDMEEAQASLKEYFIDEIALNHERTRESY